MGKHIFEANLFQNLYEFFEENQFALLPELRQFRRMTPAGFENVILSVSPYDDELWVDVHFGIRHGAVENTAQQFLTNRLDFRSDANTLLTSIGRFRQRSYFRYKIRTTDDLTATCRDIRGFFAEKGLAFFDMARNLPDLDLILNEFPLQRCPFVSNSVHRCFKGLVTARLAENPALDQLFEIYRQQLGKYHTDAPTLASFERLGVYLQYYSSN
jgi:hypothetical protein